jgi:hypothetical protein
MLVDDEAIGVHRIDEHTASAANERTHSIYQARTRR